MPRYIFTINGQRHAFDGPDLVTTQRFANQWAAQHKSRPIDDLVSQFERGAVEGGAQSLDQAQKVIDPTIPFQIAGHGVEDIARLIRLAMGPKDPNAGARQIFARSDGSFVDASGRTYNYRSDDQNPGKFVDGEGRLYERATPPVLPAPTNTLGNAMRIFLGPGPLSRATADFTAPQPKNELERIARTTGSMLPNAFGGEGGIVPRIVRVVVPAASAEGARATTQALGGSDKAQEAASFVGALTGGALTEPRSSPREARAGIVEPPSEPPPDATRTPSVEAEGPIVQAVPSPTNVVSLGAAREKRPVETFAHTASEPRLPEGGASVTSFRPRVQPDAEKATPPLFDPKSPGPPMDRASAVAALMRERIGLTPGQQAGGPALADENLAMTHPSTGPALRQARLSGQADLNRALANRALAPIGESLPNNVKLGDATISYIQARHDAALGRAGSNLYVNADPKYFENEGNILSDTYKSYPAHIIQNMDTIAQNLRLKLDSNDYGQDNVKNVLSYLDELATKYMSNMRPEYNHIGAQVQRLRGEVAALAGRQDPNYLAVSQAVDQGQPSLRLIRAANSHATSPRAGFSVANLMRAYAEKVDDPTSDVATRGGPDMFHLVQNAGAVMASKIPPPFKGEKRAVVTGAVGSDNALGGAAGGANAFTPGDTAALSNLIPETNALRPDRPPATIISFAARRAAKDQQQAPPPPPDDPPIE